MAVKNLEGRGEICPDPLTLTMTAMEGIDPGDRLKVMLDSAMALETISRWAQKAGHRVFEVQEAGPGQWEMTLEKR